VKSKIPSNAYARLAAAVPNAFYVEGHRNLRVAAVLKVKSPELAVKPIRVPCFANLRTVARPTPADAQIMTTTSGL
jgi:hypothetical protein